MEDLLAGDAWRTVGPGFDNVNDFLRSIDLTAFIDGDRPQLVQRIKELQPEASNRAIARAVGVSPRTVDRDVQSEDPAPNDAPEPGSQPADLGKQEDPAPNDAPDPEPVSDPPTSDPEPQSDATEPDSVQDWLEGGGEDYQDAKWRHEFAKTVARADDMLEFDPKDVANRADDELIGLVGTLRTRVNTFAKAVRDARNEAKRSNVRLLRGGQDA
jgi:hypothetical protein